MSQGMSKITALVIAVTIAAVLFIPFGSIVGDSTGVQTVDNESFTAEPGTWQELDGYHIVQDSETIAYDDGTGYTNLTQGTDYELNNTAGTVKILESSNVSSGDDVRASYDWEKLDGPADTIVGLLPLFVALLILVSLAVPIMDRM
jgi:hypothetical protein